MGSACIDPFCGCGSDAPLVPLAVFNRPGLNALSYRIGTFSSFRLKMLEEIAKNPALSQLTSREPDDYAVSLIEMFSAMADVMTFYSERIANEYFLGTARERASVEQLVRLIGHELSPGLAATAMLAFELEEGARVRIRKGLPVMSIPGQDEVPQTYETIEELVAHGDLNAARAFAVPMAFSAFAAGRAGFALAERPADLRIGDVLALFDGELFEEKRVEAIEGEWGGLALRFTPPIQASGFAADRTELRKFERRLALFGCNAPTTVQLYSTSPSIEPDKRWSTHAISDVLTPSGDGFYALETSIHGLSPGTRVLINTGGATPRQLTATVDATREGIATVSTTDGLDVAQLSQTVTHARFARTFSGRPALAAGSQTEIVSRDGANRLVAFLPMSGFSAATQSIDSVRVTGNPVLVATSSSSRLFVRNAERALIGLTRAAGGFEALVDYGGILTTDPAAIVLATGELLVFGRGTDARLWVIGAGTPSSGWTSLGGILTSMPSATSWGGGRVDVFVRGADRALWTRTREATWSSWISLSGALASAPAAVSTLPGRIDVVARGDDGGLLHRRWTGTAWTDWLNFGGNLAGQPAIAALPGDEVAIAVRRVDKTLGVIARRGNAWSEWQLVDAQLASDPVLTVASGTLRIAARNGDDVIVENARQVSGWAGWTKREAPVAIALDRRQSRILQVGARAIEPRGFDYPKELAGNQLVLRAKPGTVELGKGRRILIEAGEVQHFATVTSASLVSAIGGEAPDHVLLSFAPSLPRPLMAVIVRANIANASHGETQPEEQLGHGDASKSFAEFRLQRIPLTYLPEPGNLFGRASLEVRVNGVLWSATPNLFGRKPSDEVYTLKTSDDGASTVGFGDGRTGRRLPTGVLAVTARYRKGLGLVGRMRPGQLALPLERPVGLRAVANPMASIGGADPEDRDDARKNAPNGVRTFGRAVSLQDFEWLALSTRLVVRATVSWVWLGLGKAVHISVLGEGGGRVPADQLAQLASSLARARDLNWPLYLASLTQVPLTVSARIVCDPRFERDGVMANAHAALMSAFRYDRMIPGMPVHLSHVYAALQQTKGVVACDVDLFHLKGYETMTPAEQKIRAVNSERLQKHIRLFLARPLPKDPLLIDRFARRGFDNGVVPPVLPAELAFIEDPRDVTLSAVEAL
ncbi:baseplate J/gp47 family protein [Rhizobium grahamii]|uniref:PLL-like beta propeller domain-containing protein n=1 Tax=Rhizobium grahamii CCGE 502 TaxID=990285 RepID=S3IBY5_9HYPH|nr:baseplate J/gp47 family protein [Rhizobium grahamii]EPE96728.1 hypothetical protein RGCCGE502_18900 [Rhizobium grahamii CCGE 502]